MDYLIITCLICALPALLPIVRIIRRKELNMFDFLILFSTLHFCVSPVKEMKYASFTNEGVYNLFIFYFCYIYSILFIDIYCHRKFEYKNMIINTSRYLQGFSYIEFKPLGRVLIGLSLFVMLTFYLPRATIVASAVEMGAVSYEESSLTMAFGPIMKIVGFLLFLDFAYRLKSGVKDKINTAFLLIYVSILLFFPRREFLSGLLQLMLSLYSVHRSFFTLKKVSMIGCAAAFLWLVYFPFYNVIRWNPVTFDSNHPIESLSAIVEYGIANYSVNAEEQLESSQSRSLGLYNAVYMLANKNITPKYGEITGASIDVAIPKVLNPDKGTGSEGILENMTGAHVDIADSFMLLSYGEFGVFGGFYCSFLYIFFILLYSKYAQFYRGFAKSDLIPIFILFVMFDNLWNVENKVEAYISWFFGSIFTIIIVICIEKRNAIRIFRGGKELISLLLDIIKCSYSRTFPLRLAYSVKGGVYA